MNLNYLHHIDFTTTTLDQSNSNCLVSSLCFIEIPVTNVDPDSARYFVQKIWQGISDRIISVDKDAAYCGVWYESALFVNYPFGGFPTKFG